MNILHPVDLEATSSTQQSRAPARPSGVRLNLHTSVPGSFNGISLTELRSIIIEILFHIISSQADYQISERQGSWYSHPVSFSICYKVFLFLNGYQYSSTQSDKILSNLRVYLYFMGSRILYIFVFSFSTAKFPSFVVPRDSLHTFYNRHVMLFYVIVFTLLILNVWFSGMKI